MPRLRVHAFGISVDGYGAGPRQSLENPLGIGGLAAANGKDIRIGGGVATIQQFLRAGLIDHLHLAISPILLGSGEQLFADIDMLKLGYQCAEHACTPKATHVVFEHILDRQSADDEGACEVHQAQIILRPLLEAASLGGGPDFAARNRQDDPLSAGETQAA